MAQHSHKRETAARRKPRAAIIAAPLALVATAGAVGLGVTTSTPEMAAFVSAPDTTVARADLGTQLRDQETVSRAATRIERKPTKVEKLMAPKAVGKAIRQADKKLWTTEVLNLWAQPGKKAKQLGEIDAGKKVLVTGRKLYDREEVVVDGKSRWVTAGYLSAEEPFALGGDCTNGTTVPAGVSENIKKVHEAVCAEFPEITTYGTFRSDGEHSQGIAVDIMVSGDRGWQVAEFVRKYYAELGVSYLIYSQQIWSVERSGEGWRAMSDRGSATANHYDHVHVTTY